MALPNSTLGAIEMAFSFPASWVWFVTEQHGCLVLGRCVP
jgi:hypothetical protein